MANLPLADVVVAELTNEIPNTAILTDKTIDGTGVFDTLMTATKKHLLEEYDNNRITGKEYTTVYLGALQAVLAQAVAYINNHKQGLKIESDIGLIRQQTVTELAQTDNTIPTGLGFNATTAVQGLIADQKLINDQKILLATSQVAESEANVSLIGQKIITELAQTDTDISTAALALGFNNGATISGIAEGQLNKINAETDLTKQKVITELGTTADTVITGYAKNTSATIGGLLKEQLNKSAAEVSLLNQKTASEEAQTLDTTITGSNPSAVAGVMGKQKSLFTAQTDGFARDAEQKLAKLMLDPLIAQIASDSGTIIPTSLANPSIDAVIGDAKAGIGL